MYYAIGIHCQIVHMHIFVFEVRHELNYSGRVQEECSDMAPHHTAESIELLLQSLENVLNRLQGEPQHEAKFQLIKL